jgi:hypothetical protein
MTMKNACATPWLSALSILLLALGACSRGREDNGTTGGSSQPLFAKSFGGDQSDLAAGVCKTADGGHLIGGYSSSFGFGDRDVLLTKVLADGEIVWQRTLGTVDDNEVLCDIQSAADGGGFLTGSTDGMRDCDGDGFVETPMSETWVVRFDAEGTPLWQKAFGGAGLWCRGQSVRATADGGCVVAANVISLVSGYVNVNAIRLDASGGVVWEKSLGVGGRDVTAYALVPDGAGGHYVAGYANLASSWLWSFWVARLDADGGIVWQKAYEDAGCTFMTAATATTDGGLAATGFTCIDGQWDSVVLRLDDQGRVRWFFAYGGAGTDLLYGIQPVPGGGFVAVGSTDSFGCGPATGQPDYWVIRLGDDGGVIWERALGGAGMDVPYAVRAAEDGRILVAGVTESIGAGDLDCWVVTLDGDGETSLDPASGMTASAGASVVSSRLAGMSVADTAVPVADVVVSERDTHAVVAEAAPTVLTQSMP